MNVDTHSQTKPARPARRDPRRDPRPPRPPRPPAILSRARSLSTIATGVSHTHSSFLRDLIRFASSSTRSSDPPSRSNTASSSRPTGSSTGPQADRRRRRPRASICCSSGGRPGEPCTPGAARRWRSRGTATCTSSWEACSPRRSRSTVRRGASSLRGCPAASGARRASSSTTSAFGSRTLHSTPRRTSLCSLSTGVRLVGYLVVALRALRAPLTLLRISACI